ncbi:MAG: lipoprotein [Burkholderiaceae bacterium]|nr:lipoprotein [Burkholderiaceae bacterium]
MKNISQIVNRVIAITAVGLSLAGLTLSLVACGQRGPLYIPTAPAAAQRSTLVETLATPPATATSPAPAAPSTSTPAK